MGESGSEVIIVIGVQMSGGTDLFEVRGTADFLSRITGPVQGRQQHGRQNSDDRNYHQEFNQRKTF